MKIFLTYELEKHISKVSSVSFHTMKGHKIGIGVGVRASILNFGGNANFSTHNTVDSGYARSCI